MIISKHSAAWSVIVYFLLFCTTTWAAAAPAFPGAEGGGAMAKGGRGGRVIEVTNLNDSGSGSLRAAVEASGPRTVIFKVSGTIDLKSRITLKNPFITIAGQTAPKGGITLKGHELKWMTNDVIVRFIAIRPGRTSGGHQSGDALCGESNCVNNIFDHVSVSWSNDENVQVWPGSAASHHITFSWMLNAEGLTYDHPSCGLIVGTDKNPNAITNISIHHNLFMNFHNRVPWLSCKDGEVINNIIYNWAWNGTMLNGGIKADVIGNKYKWGPIGKVMEIQHTGAQAAKPAWGVMGTPSFYLSGNIGPNQPSPTGNQWTMVRGAQSSWKRTTPLPRGPFPVSIYKVTDLEDLIFKDVGSCRRLDENGNWYYDRDTVDTRLINEYKTGKGKLPKTPADVGGWANIPSNKGYVDSDHDGMPDAWEKAKGLNPNNPADGNADRNGDGYTNLEEFLNGSGVTTKAPIVSNPPVAQTPPEETPAPKDIKAPGKDQVAEPVSAKPSKSSLGTTAGSGLIKIMALGDSITLGTGRGLPLRGGWRIDFWKMCKAAGLQIDFVGSRSDGPDDLGDKHNEGHAGYKIHQLNAIAVDAMKKHQPDLVLLMAGTHDMISSWQLESAGSRLKKLIGDIVEAAPQARVVVSSIIPIHSVPGSRAAARYNAQIPGIVKSFADKEKQVEFVDTFTSITVKDLDVGGMSPTATGYSKIAKFLYNQVSPLLIERSRQAPESVPAVNIPTVAPPADGNQGSGSPSTSESEDKSQINNTDSSKNPTNNEKESGASQISGVCRIMPLGDSITWGQGIGSSGGGYRIDFLKMAKAAKMNIDFVGSGKNGPDSLPDKDNEGHSGYKIAQINNMIRAKLQTYKPDMILLMIGANDVIQGFTAQAPDQLENLIETITTTLPNARLLVSNLTPINTTSGMAGVRTFNTKIHEIVKAKAAKGNSLTFVDAFSGLTAKDIDSGGVHPTPQGYAKLANIWFSAAKNYISNNSSSDKKVTVDNNTLVEEVVEEETPPEPGKPQSEAIATNSTHTSKGTPHGNKTIVVAAYNASSQDKAKAQYVCTGKGDQNLINNAFNALSSAGGKVVLTAGTYHCDGRIIPRSKSWLEGQGPEKTTIEVVNSNGYIPITINKPEITVKGFSLAGQGFVMISTSNVSIQEVTATSMLNGKRYPASGNGMFFIWANGVNCENIEFLNCTAIDCNTHGYNMNGDKSPKLTKNIKFLNCRAIRCGFGTQGGSRSEWLTGFDFHEAQNLDGLLVQDCIADDNWQCGFHLEPDDWNGTYMRNIVFKDCLSQNNGKRHPKGEQSYYASGFHGFKNSTLTNCIAKNNANCGFFGIYTSNAVFNNCSDSGSNHGFKFAKNNDGITLNNCSTRDNKTFGLWISFTNNMKVNNFHQYNVRGSRGVQSILGWYKDEAKYQKPVTNSVFEITAHGGSGEIINKAGNGNQYILKKN